MKEILVTLGIGFFAFQFLFVIALMAAARRPIPQFQAQGPGGAAEQMPKELEMAA